LNQYEKYVKRIAKRDDDNVKATIFFNMGKILMLQEKFSSAVGYFKKTEKIYESQGDYSKQVYLLYDIGIECKRNILPDVNDPGLPAPIGVLPLDIILMLTTTPTTGRSEDFLKKTAKKSFKKALKVLTMQNMLELEKELVKKLQSELGKKK
jgi:tetratricopeptide (TPR) repeat protein